ncbi:transcription-repair coupling factor [bacterium]|nr:transcription-repair coupling factor [bacterium]
MSAKLKTGSFWDTLLSFLPFEEIIAPFLEGKGSAWIGVENIGSIYTLLTAGILRKLGRVAVIVPNFLEGRRIYEELLELGLDVQFLPPPSEEFIEDELLHWQINALEKLKRGEGKVVIPLQSLGKKVVERDYIEIIKGEELYFEELLRKLVDFGYERVDLVEAPGEFAVRGGIIDVFPPHLRYPLRFVFFGDVVEELRLFDPSTQRSYEKIEKEKIFALNDSGKGTTITQLIDSYPKLLLNIFPQDFRIEGDGVLFITPQSPETNLEVLSPPSYRGQFNLLLEDVLARDAVGWTQVLCTRKGYGVVNILREKGVKVKELQSYNDVLEEGWVNYLPLSLRGGFQIPHKKFLLLTDEELVGIKKPWRPKSVFSPREVAKLSSITDMQIGDLIVHPRHGIGAFRGIFPLEVQGVKKDYICLEYAGGTKLYLPIDEVNLLQRYIGESNPPLSRLGSGEWEKARRKAKESALKLAKELIKVYAQREIERGIAFSPDTPWQAELEAYFPYEETEDQRRAIEEVKRDMESPKPMERLICGDVGFGKTEVALRAAFKAVMDGYQVAILVPTTVLAQQHYTVFKERLAPFPVRVEVLSRFISRASQKSIIEDIAKGSVDIVIGTHRLLSKDVKFKNLGLLIIDEEQRFGVLQKEALKKVKTKIDVLVLTATPIPRTLNMALNNIMSISTISEPPEGRLPIKTLVVRKDDKVIMEAIRRELARGGQCFYVHNRIEDIYEEAQRIKGLCPNARVKVAHGDMSEKELEKTMMDFYDGKIDVLVATTIIENGLDVPNANTIIIDDAPSFGLGQLYQLRGRVGRSYRQAYAYLLYDPKQLKTKEAKERLQAIEEFSHLGSGLRLALRDLEIRGAGNILGPQQHGHIQAVGFDMYISLLQEAIAELRGTKLEEEDTSLPSVDLPVTVFIPDEYILSPAIRLDFYKRIANCRNEEELRDLEEEMKDRFGELPAETRNLFRVMYLRILAKKAGLNSIIHRRGKVYMTFSKKIDKKKLRKLGGGRVAEEKIILDVRGLAEQKLLKYLENTLSKLI